MYLTPIACGILGMQVGGHPYTYFKLQGLIYRNKPFKSTHLQYDKMLDAYTQNLKE